MRRTSSLLAAAVLALCGLTACGEDGGTTDTAGGDTDAYCDRLTEVIEGAEDLSADPQAPLDAITELESLAPEEVKADWSTLLAAFEQLQNLDPSQVDPNDPDMGFDREALQAANDAIEQHARDECGVDLGASTPTSPSTTGVG